MTEKYRYWKALDIAKLVQESSESVEAVQAPKPRPRLGQSSRDVSNVSIIEENKEQQKKEIVVGGGGYDDEDDKDLPILDMKRLKKGVSYSREETFSIDKILITLWQALTNDEKFELWFKHFNSYD